MPSLARYLPVLTAALFLGQGWFLLATGHPHEDAYILFIYAEQLAHNGVITYFDGGPPIEGATDFLWMLLLSAFVWMGYDVAVMALVLNGFGLFLITTLLVNEVKRLNGPKALAVGLALILPFHSIAQASYAGFSTGLYAAGALALVVLLQRGQARGLIFLPLLSIALGLMRPDGVILGVVATVAGLFWVPSDARRRYLASAAAAFVIGVGYFLWRWDYFGQTLPLPLYVKSAGDGVFEGLSPNLRWMKINAVLILLTAGAVIAGVAPRRRIIVSALPGLALLIALTFATQSQNVSFRFQAPATVFLLLGAVQALCFILTRAPLPRTGAVLLTLSVAVAHVTYHLPRQMSLAARLRAPDYINSFPVLLRPHVPTEATLALTEAGRFAYWLAGRKLDLVGLNTAETARFGASAAFLQAQAPDLLFWHVAETIEPRCPDDTPTCRISQAQLLGWVDKAGLPPTLQVSDRVRRAPLAIYDHLGDNPGVYELHAARYGSGHAHLYAIRTHGKINAGVFAEKLGEAFHPDAARSYLAFKRGQ